ncbi:MAG: hypothetical protein AAGD25_32435 [Cyanobacteria bacterium P01_F01_bin.150]
MTFRRTLGSGPRDVLSSHFDRPIVTGYMSHSLTNMIMDLKRTGALRGQVRLVQVRGKTGVLREIIAFFEKNKPTE